MVLPAETVAQLRRRVIDICQEHSRAVLNAVRELPLLLGAYRKGELRELTLHQERIVEALAKVLDLKQRLLVELSGAGSLLPGREDFLRLAATCSEIADYASSIAFRIGEIAKRKWSIREEIIDGTLKLSEAVLDVVVNLRKLVYSVTYGSERASEAAKQVESAEAAVDSLYRKLDLDVAESRADLPAILVWRDVIRCFEEMADKAEDAADAARILALSTF